MKINLYIAFYEGSILSNCTRSFKENIEGLYADEMSRTFDRNGDNFKTCSFNNSFERVDNGASVNVVNLVRYLPHPDSGCKSQELGFHQFQTVEGRK